MILYHRSIFIICLSLLLWKFLIIYYWVKIASYIKHVEHGHIWVSSYGRPHFVGHMLRCWCVAQPQDKADGQSAAGLWYLRSCPVNQGLYQAILETDIGGHRFHAVSAHSVRVRCWGVCTDTSFHPHNHPWGRDDSSHFTDKENESQRRQVACPKSRSKARRWLEAAFGTCIQHHCTGPPLRKPLMLFCVCHLALLWSVTSGTKRKSL